MSRNDFIADSVRAAVMVTQIDGFDKALKETVLAARGFIPSGADLWFYDESDDLYFMDWYESRGSQLPPCPEGLGEAIVDLWFKDHGLMGDSAARCKNVLLAGVQCQ